MADGASAEFKVSKVAGFFIRLLGPERDFYGLAVIYGIRFYLAALEARLSQANFSAIALDLERQGLTQAWGE